jgi:hypothetical protein
MTNRIMLKKVRLSFPVLFTPKARDEGKDPQYSTMLLIPKSDKEAIKALREAEKAAAAEKWGKAPSKLASIIHDGDDEDNEGYPEREGHYYMTVSANQQYRPGIVDKNRQPVIDQSEVYSGVYANVTVRPFGYDFKGKKGVSFGLGNVQILGYGDSLAGGISAEDEFDDVDDDDII